MMKMFWTDISKQVSAGSSPPTLVSDCISRVIRAEYWINQDKEARRKFLRLIKRRGLRRDNYSPGKTRTHMRKARLVMRSSILSCSERTKGREMSLARVSREITLKRKVTEAMRVITIMTIQCAHNAGRSTWEYVE
ncbi:hypothetical protein TIFTF001_023274 [Ficus carica]|uniref:Uncharacterized protein n=1 Tax=Ficus carica TaxID=3494 RepID=A0AA88AFV7_FICCA|nr:hypothetical protein TIFTF001_023274 [Ficus carica]